MRKLLGGTFVVVLTIALGLLLPSSPSSSVESIFASVPELRTSRTEADALPPGVASRMGDSAQRVDAESSRLLGVDNGVGYWLAVEPFQNSICLIADFSDVPGTEFEDGQPSGLVVWSCAEHPDFVKRGVPLAVELKEKSYQATLVPASVTSDLVRQVGGLSTMGPSVVVFDSGVAPSSSAELQVLSRQDDSFQRVVLSDG